MAQVFVIAGTQGAGKTTIASLLATRFARAAHISADTLQTMIVSGRAWPEANGRNVNDEPIGDEVTRQLRLRLRNACLLARSFRDAGITAIIDDIVVGSRFAHLREDLEDIDFYYVMLLPSREAVRAHERERGTELWREWEWLTDSIERTTPRVGLWIDNSAQTAAETVDEILRRAPREGLVRAQPSAVRA